MLAYLELSRSFFISHSIFLYICLGKLKQLVWKGLIYLFESNDLLDSRDFPVDQIIQAGTATMYKFNSTKLKEDIEIFNEQSLCLKAFSYIIKNDIFQSEAWKCLISSNRM